MRHSSEAPGSVIPLDAAAEHSASGSGLAGATPGGVFAVVIPTHNRSALVTRAIESVYATGCHDVEVIVVDDASEDDTVEVIARRFPGVRLLHTMFNSGPGAARNLGIANVSAQWVLMLDDDDLLMRGALRTVSEVVGNTAGLAQYPVIQFAHTNARMRDPFLVASLRDLIGGNLTGDFAPLIQTQTFRNQQLRYPECRIGGEHLLWFQIAHTCGIPTWATNIIQLTRDAPLNLCSTRAQLASPREYAELQEQTLAIFGKIILDISPAFHRKKSRGAIAYRLLAGDRAIARSGILGNPIFGGFERFVLWCLSYLPHPLIHSAFRFYRGLRP